MYTYSFSAEFLSLIISTILFAFSCENNAKPSRSRTIYLRVIVLNIITIFVDLLSLVDMEYAALLPAWLNYGINSIYYSCCFILIGLSCNYLFQQLLVHVYDKKVLHIFQRITMAITLASLLVLLINLPTGIIFCFSDSSQYLHGPLWITGYIELAFMLGLIAFCFKKYFNRIDYSGRKFLFLAIPVVLMLFIYQIVYPDFLLNGTICAIVTCLCYLCFESHKEEMDAITKLGSLSSFLNKLDTMEAAHRKYHILVVSLKNYGAINTSYGFSKGNEVLYYLAAWLQNYFPQGNVYRFAPVSFGIILPYEEITEDSHSATIMKLYEDFPYKIEMENKTFRLTPFFFEQSSDGQNHSSAAIMEALEYGLQIAKKEELDILSFHKKMQAQLARKKYLTDYLTYASEHRLFEMWYQPIYCPTNGRFCSAEALMRLKDPEGHYISPEEFIPLAEDMGLIAQISKQTMQDILLLMKDSDRLGVRQISVNLSMQQLQTPHYMEELFAMQKNHQIHEDKISYEITERMLISWDPRVEEVLGKIRSNGHTLLMDDFGTGYSNFSMVLAYPFQKIKIDKSLLYSSQKDHYKMLSMLIKLFHAYGKQIVVEGVETKEQADTLCQLGVDFIQGYYYAKPMSEQAYRAFLQSRHSLNQTPKR